ncbi:hypothetical protein ASG29_00115 [Sphingomonas sp. Leaf412]|uniref:acyltransferase family protein n=1 Tax=Sphingomonas sp. Leaf412 TaxID=1736370 RepID=UPI0006F3214E|nr:acyltransferase family protein [Sphingomonas sp. Leaf412]KQT34622.1 hypothetical protein ASG29_00115 [Sphingomonas sp. Leaf412]
MTIRYRADIDGLRAVAVVPVVLFHAGIAALSGGYVGVDVFFVISGYLITQTLLADIDRGRFSIVAFYERRIRRIYPALFAMLFVAFLASAFLLSSFDQQRFAKSMAATVLFASNVVFFRESGYFDAAAELKPLLHTWSLAVEEQYYIVFPLLLALVMRWGRGARNALLVAIALGSLALSIYATPRWPGFNFYLPFTRAWELLAGALLAVGAIPAVRRAAAREVLAVAGLAMIVAAIMLYRPGTPFPGLTAIPPVLGAALLIHAGEGTRVARLLTWRPVVYVGLISYSLYLWHWPVIVFTRFAMPESIGAPTAPAVIVGTIAASFVLGSLSMHTVERYFRNRDRFGRRAIFVGGAAGSLALLALAGLSFATQGLAFRNPAAHAIVSRTAGELDRLNRSPCLKLAGAPPAAGECVLGADVVPSIALFGDSSGAQLAASMDVLAKQRGLAVWQLTKAGCPPIAAARFVPANALRRECPAFVARAQAAILADPAIRTVVIAGRWDALAGDLYRAADAGGDPTLAAAQALASRRLAATAAAFRAAGKRVLMLGPIPLPPRDPFVCYRTALFAGRDVAACGGYPAAQEAARRGKAMATILDGVVRDGVPVIATTDLFCDLRTCRTASAQGPLYMDDVHLTREAAAAVDARLLDAAAPRR